MCFCQGCIFFPVKSYALSAAHSIGGILLTDTLEKRACELAVYIIETGSTVRRAAKEFHISKSTVHKDISTRLPQFNRALYLQVKEVLDINKAQRHIRGGMATKNKYANQPNPNR